MSIWKKIFSKRLKQIPIQAYDFDLSNLQGKAIEDFAQLNADSRLVQTMRLGDTGDLKYFALMRFAIESDPDTGVKFAALKRIHLFKEHPDLKPMLIKMDERGFGKGLEPYFSMALSRMGIISIDDFKNRINSST